MSQGNFRAVISVYPAAHANPRSRDRRYCLPLFIEQGRPRFDIGKESSVLVVHCHGEVLPVVLAEIEIDASPHHGHRGNLSLDELEPAQALLEQRDVRCIANIVESFLPDPGALFARAPFRIQKIRRTRPVVRKGVDPGETLAEHLLLEPESFFSAPCKDMGENTAMPVDARTAVLQRHFPLLHKSRKRFLRFLCLWPGFETGAAERQL